MALRGKFPVHQEDLHGLSLKILEPIKELVLARMSRESVDGKDFRRHGDFLIINTDFFCAVNDLAARCALRLEADKDNAGAGSP